MAPPVAVALQKKPAQKYNDSLTDHHIDILRTKVIKKEANERALAEEEAKKLSKKKSAAEKKIEQSFSMDKGSSYTYDTQGQIMQVTHLKVEKLPRLQGATLEVDSISTIANDNGDGRKTSMSKRG